MNTSLERKNTIVSVHSNKKALFDYEVIKEYEAGIALFGHEVKSIRAKQCNLKGAYVTLQSGTPILRGFHISPYSGIGNKTAIDPTRERILLLHKNDILSLAAKLKEKGLALIPTEVYLKGNLIKLKVALTKGRKKYDKKQLLKERDLDRNAQISIKNF